MWKICARVVNEPSVFFLCSAGATGVQKAVRRSVRGWALAAPGLCLRNLYKYLALWGGGKQALDIGVTQSEETYSGLRM